jgi:hypothetical protein
MALTDKRWQCCASTNIAMSGVAGSGCECVCVTIVYHCTCLHSQSACTTFPTASGAAHAHSSTVRPRAHALLSHVTTDATTGAAEGPAAAAALVSELWSSGCLAACVRLLNTAHMQYALDRHADAAGMPSNAASAGELLSYVHY